MVYVLYTVDRPLYHHHYEYVNCYSAKMKKPNMEPHRNEALFHSLFHI